MVFKKKITVYIISKRYQGQKGLETSDVMSEMLLE